MKDLADFFEKLSWGRGKFEDPKQDAIKKLAGAHRLAWEAFGLREKVALPIGAALNAKVIWTAALEQGKLDAAFDARLKAARPYLFACAKLDEFDADKFEEAAKLLEELCTR